MTGLTDLNAALILLVVALLAAPVTGVAGFIRPRLAAPVATAAAALAFAAALWGVEQGGGAVDVAWAPTWNMRLSFALDGLAQLYALLATGIGFLVVLYSARYLPLHLDHQARPPADGVRFYSLLLLFMGAMTGLVMAQDLIVLFVFWDLTAITSYFLIGYDHQAEDSRSAALMALLITGVTAVCLLIAAVLLAGEYETFALPELIAQAESGPGLALAGTLMAIAGLAKSAQAPFHIWLPRAMAAPTPVSAYLHSAAMVAAGVFLLGRLHPLLARTEWLLDALLIVGFLSMAIGGVLALTRDVLKQILAYSTISQYGYVVVMLGLGGAEGLGGASFYVIAHALAKSALFLTAGAVTEGTGQTKLSSTGGLWRQLPALAAASGVAAASLAALPVTIGFFKDELFFHAALARSNGFAVLAVLGAALTFAYIGRFWIGIFLGPRRQAAHRLPALLVLPVVVLAALTLLGGLVVQPFSDLAADAATVSLSAPVSLDPAYHLDTRAENLLALAAYGLGIGLLSARSLWWGAATAAARLGDLVGPARLYAATLAALNGLSDRIHRFEVRDLRSRLAFILGPAGVLVGLGVLATPNAGAFRIGSFQGTDLPLTFMIGVSVLAALAAILPRDHLVLALLLSCVGYSLAVVYAFLGSPDVALVAVLIETIFALLFLGMLSLLPRTILQYESRRPSGRLRRRRDPLVGIIAGVAAFIVVWGALSRPASQQSVVVEQTELTPAAHGGDIVTVILADFRGLDTMGEITVIGIALLGIVSLLRVGRLR